MLVILDHSVGRGASSLSSYILYLCVKCFTGYWDEQKKRTTLQVMVPEITFPKNTSPFLCTRLGRVLNCRNAYRGFQCKESLNCYYLNRNTDKLQVIK